MTPARRAAERIAALYWPPEPREATAPTIEAIIDAEYREVVEAARALIRECDWDDTCEDTKGTALRNARAAIGGEG